MKMRLLTSLGVFAAMTIGASVTIPTAAASGPSATVGLHNTTAGVEACPAGVGLAWHFVAPPKSQTDFISITLVLDGATVVINSWLEHPLNGDAYVTVPDGYTVASLESGTFVVTDSSLQHKNVRLSHTCDGDGPDPSERPPDVEVTKTAVVTYVDGYDWAIDKRIVSVVPHATSADINYAIDVTKSALSTVPGSYVVKGVITVKNFDPEQYADITVTENGLTTTAATCSLDGTADDVLDPLASVDFPYTCTGIAGIPVGTDTNTATATVHFGTEDFPTQGTVDFDWGDATVRETLDETATLTDDNLPGFSQQFDASGSHAYTKSGVAAGGGNCDPGFTNTATLVEDDTQATHTDSVTVQLCTTTGGHTIGYWFAAPAGNAQTLAAFPTLKTTYPNVLGPLTLSTSKKVKDFGAAANCSGDCTTMLQAQFIATAMSVRTGAPAFGAQCVYVPGYVSGGGTSSISGLLTWINANWALVSTAQRVELKNILDAVNNNAALACIP